MWTTVPGIFVDVMPLMSVMLLHHINFKRQVNQQTVEVHEGKTSSMGSESRFLSSEYGSLQETQ